MSCQPQFFLCKHCGNVIERIQGKVPVVCCGEPMTELIPGSVEASSEKHLPVVTCKGGTVHVNVGSAEHPMGEEHHIAWIVLQTDKGLFRRCLDPKGKPEATFALHEETPIAAYDYCNLHGLWKTEIKG